MSIATHHDETVNITENVVNSFMDLMLQYINSLEEVFPECFKISKIKLAYTIYLNACTTQQELFNCGVEGITKYHASMSPYYARCMDRDETLLSEDIEFIKEIDLKTKWDAGLHPQTQAAIWSYIIKLNEYSSIYSMYNQVPNRMMSNIESVATQIATQISNGTMSLKDININELSQSVINSVSAEDMQSLKNSVCSGNGMDVGNLYRLLGSVMKTQMQ